VEAPRTMPRNLKHATLAGREQSAWHGEKLETGPRQAPQLPEPRTCERSTCRSQRIHAAEGRDVERLLVANDRLSTSVETAAFAEPTPTRRKFCTRDASVAHQPESPECILVEPVNREVGETGVRRQKRNHFAGARQHDRSAIERPDGDQAGGEART